MDLYEYQGKELFRRYGLPTGEGRLAQTPAEARAAAEELGGSAVVKAQVLTGGRGKAGGVKVAASPQEAEAHAAAILGMGIKGHTVRRLWIERVSEIAREYYLSVTLDRGAKKPLFMFTTEGGVEIEEVAARNPGALVRLHVDPLEGFHPWHGRALTFGAAIADAAERRQIERLCAQLYEVFSGCDATLCEINPLVVTKDDRVLALDAKMAFDDNAIFRRANVAEMRDIAEEDPREAQAAEIGLNYVGLSGDIGCIVNGAGLAMATMDMIKLSGGEPANFLDVGGGASPERVAAAFRLVLSDENVKAILVNIFAGINRCDWVAQGVVQAAQGLRVPLVVRLAGTNVAEGQRIVRESGLRITMAETLADAAQQAVQLARQQAAG
jgi:succinyl-CoA synthetase beta subunit